MKTLRRRSTTKRGAKLKRNLPEIQGYEVREQIKNILADRDAPATARVTAARTLAEMDGYIGRHQSAPDKSSSAALSGLSRDDLVAELERLRTAFELGLVS